MRNFFLGKDEAVIVNGDIKVTVIDIDGDTMKSPSQSTFRRWDREIGEIESFQDMELVSTG